jgi:hypothetical protein
LTKRTKTQPEYPNFDVYLWFLWIDMLLMAAVIVVLFLFIRSCSITSKFHAIFRSATAHGEVMQSIGKQLSIFHKNKDKKRYRTIVSCGF